jgi:hypothetical protein
MDRDTVFRVLDEVYRVHGGFTLMHGDCPNGADAHADAWGRLRNRQGFPIEIKRKSADWKRYGKAAGYRRNAEMVKTLDLETDFCIAFILDESPGSEHTRTLAEKAGIPTKIYRRSSMNLPVRRVEEELVLRDVRLIYKNFRGEKQQFNEEGRRNFSVWLDNKTAMELQQMGWNPKLIKRTADGPEELREWHLKVNVSYDNRPPRIFFITQSTKSRNPIDEELVFLVDRGIFDKVSVTLSPYNHRMNGGGVTAYLRTMYCVLHEDPLDLEYSEYQLPGEDPAIAIENGRRGPLELEQGDNGEIIIIEDSGWDQDHEGDEAA